MDSVTFKTPKKSSNISGVFLCFSKLCKLRSLGVFSDGNPKLTNDSYNEVSEDNGDRKIHPQPSEESLLTRNTEGSEEATILTLFAAISALKSAYVRLQQAHIPYEPGKIQDADELIVSELESISELQCLYIGKSSLCLEIQEHEKLLEEFPSKIPAKETEIIRLRREVEELDRKNKELEEKIKQKMQPDEQFSLLNREWTPSVFSDAFKMTSKSIHDFTKLLIRLMKASGWDLDRAAHSVDNSVIYTERSHKKFAFEAYLSHVMLEGSQVECFKLDHFDRVMSFSNPFDALMEDPDSDYGRFCRSKYVVAVKSRMESWFFGNLDQRVFVLRVGHPRTPFYQAFVRMARWVWALQVMARSFIPEAEIFSPRKGTKFLEEFMESVVNLAAAEGEGRVEVGLTVMPGFKIGSDVIRCRAYPCSSSNHCNSRR